MFLKKLDQKYVLDIFRLLKWSVIIQALQLAGTFILTLYFTKEHFGSLSFLISVSTLFEMAVGLQYNTAAIVHEEPRSAKSLMLISTGMAILFSGIILLAILSFYFFAPPVYNQLNSYGFIMALPFILITNFIFNNGMLILKYFGKIREIIFFRTWYVAAMLVTKLLAALIWANLTSLIYAHLISLTVTCILFMFRFRHQIIAGYQAITYRHAVMLLKANYRFPRYSILSNIISAAATISFPILITVFFGLHNNGVYYLTTIFIFQPLQLILQAISDAFLQKIKVMFYENKQQLFEFIKTQQKIILQILIPYLIIAFLAGEFLFSYILPAQWTEIGKFIKFIMMYYVFTSIYSPFSIVADYMNQQRFLMIFNLLLFLFQLTILYFLHSIFDFTFVILIISVLTALLYAFINFYMLKKLKMHT